MSKKKKPSVVRGPRPIAATTSAPVSLKEMTYVMLGGASGAILGLMFAREPKIIDDLIKTAIMAIGQIPGGLKIPFPGMHLDGEPGPPGSTGASSNPFDGMFEQPTRRPQRSKSRSRKPKPPPADPSPAV